MGSLGNIETSIFNNLREIEKNLILIQEKIRNFEAEKIRNFEAEKIRNFEAEKIRNFDSGEKNNLIIIKNPTKNINYDMNSRETYDIPSDNKVEVDTSRIDSILESARNTILEKRVYKKKANGRGRGRGGGRSKQTIGFSNYVIDTSSSEDE
jgi:hypothetical protein